VSDAGWRAEGGVGERMVEQAVRDGFLCASRFPDLDLVKTLLTFMPPSVRGRRSIVGEAVWRKPRTSGRPSWPDMLGQSLGRRGNQSHPPHSRRTRA
jgi:hypothetical protein